MQIPVDHRKKIGGDGDTNLNGNGDNDEGADAMGLAWQEFMLTGGSDTQYAGVAAGKKKKKKKGLSQQDGGAGGVPDAAGNTPTTPLSAAKESRLELKSHQNSTQRLKIRKKYWQLLNAFKKTMRVDWLDVDDHLGDVISSIVNLRDRILMSSTCLRNINGESHSTAVSSVSKSLGCGYRQKRSQGPEVVVGHLVKEDLELALSHGLMQHEKMLSGARRLISSLNQAEEALGRRLEELVTFQMNVLGIFQIQVLQDAKDKVEDDDLALFGTTVTNWARQVYTELAEELYRKQGLVQMVLDSVNDELLYCDDSSDNESTPLKAATQCHRQWPRGESGRPQITSLLSSTPWE